MKEEEMEAERASGNGLFNGCGHGGFVGRNEKMEEKIGANHVWCVGRGVVVLLEGNPKKKWWKEEKKVKREERWEAREKKKRKI